MTQTASSCPTPASYIMATCGATVARDDLSGYHQQRRDNVQRFSVPVDRLIVRRHQQGYRYRYLGSTAPLSS